MTKRIEDYLDEKGFVGHLDVDGKFEGGDSSNRTAFHDFFKYINSGRKNWLEHHIPFKEKIDLIYLESGEPTRHHDRTKWHGQSGTLSGDGLVPVVIAASLLSFHQLERLWKLLVPRFFFAWNTKKIGQHGDEWKIPDWLLFRVIALFIRGRVEFRPVSLLWAFPTLLVLDFFLIFSVLARCIAGLIDRDNVGPDLCLSGHLIQAQIICPTPFSYLARKTYKYLRPLPGTIEFRLRFKDDDGPLLAWRWYFRHQEAPPLDEFARPSLEAF